MWPTKGLWLCTSYNHARRGLHQNREPRKIDKIMVLQNAFMKSQDGRIGLVSLKESSIDKYVIGPGVRGLNKSPQCKIYSSMENILSPDGKFFFSLWKILHLPMANISSPDGKYFISRWNFFSPDGKFLRCHLVALTASPNNPLSFAAKYLSFVKRFHSHDLRQVCWWIWSWCTQPVWLAKAFMLALPAIINHNYKW